MSIYDKIKQDNRDQQLIKESIETLINICNRNHGLNIGATIAESIQNNHRTLQASLIRELLTALQEYGKTPYYDLRNQAAVEYCASLPDHAIPYI